MKTKDAVLTVKQLVAEDVLRFDSNISYELDVVTLVAGLDSAVEAIKKARNELGVPNELYPSPVANASDYLNNWLKKHGYNQDDETDK